MGVHALGGAFVPWIDLREDLRELEAGVERRAALVVFYDALLDVVEADALEAGGRAVKIAGFFAVKLDEGAAVFHHLVLSLDLGEEVAFADLHAAVATDIEFPAAVHRDDAEVLDGRFGAIARAAGDCQLDLVRRPGA